jgi:hypothetical protein
MLPRICIDGENVNSMGRRGVSLWEGGRLETQVLNNLGPVGHPIEVAVSHLNTGLQPSWKGPSELKAILTVPLKTGTLNLSLPATGAKGRGKSGVNLW